MISPFLYYKQNNPSQYFALSPSFIALLLLIISIYLCLLMSVLILMNTKTKKNLTFIIFYLTNWNTARNNYCENGYWFTSGSICYQKDLDKQSCFQNCMKFITMRKNEKALHKTFGVTGEKQSILLISARIILSWKETNDLCTYTARYW